MEYLIDGLDAMDGTEISPTGCYHIGCPSVCTCVSSPGGVGGGCVGIYQCDWLGDCIFR